MPQAPCIKKEKYPGIDMNLPRLGGNGRCTRYPAEAVVVTLRVFGSGVGGASSGSLMTRSPLWSMFHSSILIHGYHCHASSHHSSLDIMGIQYVQVCLKILQKSQGEVSSPGNAWKPLDKCHFPSPSLRSLVIHDSFEDPHLTIGHSACHARYLDIARLDL